jgi:hypothetical protein
MHINRSADDVRKDKGRKDIRGSAQKNRPLLFEAYHSFIWAFTYAAINLREELEGDGTTGQRL